MNTPADRPVRRRARIRATLATTAAVAVVALAALAGVGGTYALWNASVPVENAGIITVGPAPTPTPSAPPAQCTQAGYQNHEALLTYTHPADLAPQMYDIRMLDGFWSGQVGYWSPQFHVDNGHVQQVPSLYPTGMAVGETRAVVVRAYAQNPAGLLIAENTVWITRQDGEFWVSCTPPATPAPAPAAPTPDDSDPAPEDSAPATDPVTDVPAVPGTDPDVTPAPEASPESEAPATPEPTAAPE